MRRALLLLLLLISLALPQASACVAAPVSLSVNPLAARGDVLTFSVDQAGIVMFTPADLATAGWDVAQLDPAQIHAWRDGREVPLAVEEASGQVAALGLAVAPSASRWTSAAVYWLSIKPAPGLRAPLPALQLGWTWDADTTYVSAWATQRGDRWWSGELRDGAARTVTLDLPAAASADSPLALTVRTTGAGGQLQVVLDDQVLGAPVLASAQALTLTLPLAQGLAAGAHTLALTSSAPDAVLLDQVRLPALAVPLPALPTPALARHTAVSPAGAGDTLIVTHASLRPALGPLVAAHQALGEQVQVVDVQDAYDLFSDGERSPEALRSYIHSAVQHWSPAPRRVLLVGAGTVALRGTPPAGRETLIPPYLVATDPRGEVSCDTCYGRVQADDVRDQLVPDLAVGRLPARTLDEARVLVTKTVTALQAPPSGPWHTRAVLLADNDQEADGTPDLAGPFSTTSEAVAGALVGYALTRLYYAPGQTGAPDGAFDGDVARLRCRLFRALDGGMPDDRACPPNSPGVEPGAALWVYVGHGSPWQWGYTGLRDPVPYLAYLYDADGLHNGQRLPILLTLTCLSGDWANPELETMEERLLQRAEGGTVASLGSAGLGVNSGHAVFGAAVVGSLAQGAELGAAHQAGLRAVTAEGAHADLAYAFSLLGDPSVRLPWRALRQLWVPGVRR